MPWSKDNLPSNVKTLLSEDSWTDCQIETFVISANEALKENNEDKAIALGITQAKEMQNKDLDTPSVKKIKEPSGGSEITKHVSKVEVENAKEKPAVYYCKHIKAGLVGYQDETVLVQNDALKQMMKSMGGVPVYVNHQDVDYSKLEKEMDGVVSECLYNELDGCFWAKFVVTTDIGHAAVRSGYAVSNAYVPTEFGSGGEYHNIKYDREVLNGHYTHLAVVDNPRYEDACIMTPEDYKSYNMRKKAELEEFTNSKTESGARLMLKLFKKEEIKADSGVELADAFVTLENGKEKSILEMVNAMEEDMKKKEDMKNEDEKDKSKDYMSEMVNACGEDMTVKELVNRYSKMMKKNAMDEDEMKKKEEMKKKDMENEGDDDIKELEIKANAKLNEKVGEHDDVLKDIQNAKFDDKSFSKYEPMDVKTARGKALYG